MLCGFGGGEQRADSREKREVRRLKGVQMVYVAVKSAE